MTPAAAGGVSLAPGTHRLEERGASMSVGFRWGFRNWATRHLQKCDLSALAASPHGGKFDEERTKRLARRGFVTVQPSGRCALTPRGRLVLILRRIMPH